MTCGVSNTKNGPLEKPVFPFELVVRISLNKYVISTTPADIGRKQVQVFNPNLTRERVADFHRIRLMEIAREEHPCDQEKELEEATQILENLDPNFHDTLGRTPLHYALLNRKFNLAILLRKFNASLQTQDREGVSPAQLVIAMHQNHSLYD